MILIMDGNMSKIYSKYYVNDGSVAADSSYSNFIDSNDLILSPSEAGPIREEEWPDFYILQQNNSSDEGNEDTKSLDGYTSLDDEITEDRKENSGTVSKGNVIDQLHNQLGAEKNDSMSFSVQGSSSHRKIVKYLDEYLCWAHEANRKDQVADEKSTTLDGGDEEATREEHENKIRRINDPKEVLQITID